MIAMYVVDKSFSAAFIAAPFFLVHSSAMWRAIPMQRAIPKTVLPSAPGPQHYIFLFIINKSDRIITL